MTEPIVPAPGADATRLAGADATRPGTSDGTFRWRAFFRRSAEPLFVLDRRQRLLFVNAAWEALTGISASDAALLICRRPRPAGPDDSPRAVVEHALTPPPEARRGALTRVRRLLPGRGGQRWWDVEFFPLRQAGKMEGVLILGRITPVAVEEPAAVAPLPERLVALRERTTQRLRAGPAVRRRPGYAPPGRTGAAGRANDGPGPAGRRAGDRQADARPVHPLPGADARTALRRDRLHPSAAIGAGRGPFRRFLLASRGRLPAGAVAAAARRAAQSMRRLLEADHNRPGPRVLAGCGDDPARKSAPAG